MTPRRFHINPKSGNPTQCRAKLGNCPFGAPEEHYGTREAAQEGYERLQQEQLFPEHRKNPKALKWVGGHYDGERDVVDGRPGRWSTSITTGFGPTRKPTFFADDAGRQDDPASLPNSFEDDQAWRSVRRPIEDSATFVGYLEAQTDLLKYMNHEEPYEWSQGHVFYGPIAQYGDEMVRRYLNGEKSKWDSELRERNFKQVSPKESMFWNLTDKYSNIYSQQSMEVALTFTEEHLLPVLDRLGVEGVSVSSLKNGREVGLIFTVLTPTGSTRSFSLYEHRNTDALVINGEENWDPEIKPYGPYSEDARGKESKNNFFAEFSVHAPRKQVAESLGYFLKAAQRGELESDQELINKVERLDWGAILSEQIPGFGEWLQEKREEEAARRDPEESFARWEREFE